MNSEHSEIAFELVVPYRMQVYFTRHAFAAKNTLLRKILAGPGDFSRRIKVLAYVDDNIPSTYVDRVPLYFDTASTGIVLTALHRLPGGEAIKNDQAVLTRIYNDVERHGICRHSYIIAIGGGALLDVVGYAAATAHRGLRHIRFPSTALAQGDAGVGVKNGINFRGKKNFLGTFKPPEAIINDFLLLSSLSRVELRNGYSEAIKVALIKDRTFFEWIEQKADALNAGDDDAVAHLVRRSAELHIDHIATSGDPFESGASRPLDFGHWAAHKLEQLSDFSVGHGEAVAIGLAIDIVYSRLTGHLTAATCERVLKLLETLQFPLTHEKLTSSDASGKRRVLEGLDEFREHLGGELTVTLIDNIGSALDVHIMAHETVVAAIDELLGRKRRTVV